jgi:hypothetical protein
METAAKRRLGDIIVERRLITDEQLQTALEAQRACGSKLGEVLVQLGMITRVALAGVISEQWEEQGLTATSRKLAETGARQALSAAAELVATAPSVVEVALRERLEALTADLALRDARIAQQDATIAALLGRQTAD